MTDQPSDPIAVAVAMVCDKFKIGVRDSRDRAFECARCGLPPELHWLRALREQLAETERERDELKKTLEEVSCADHIGQATLIADNALARTHPEETGDETS